MWVHDNELTFESEYCEPHLCDGREQNLEDL